MNYGNRNASSNYSPVDLGRGYLAAVVTSVGIALVSRTVFASTLNRFSGGKYLLVNATFNVVAGASAGVSVAFGSPIGGALFCYELSRPNTFWKFEMIWKVFFACCMGTFSLAVFNSFEKKDDDGTFSWSGTALKFGSLESTKVP